MNVKMNSFALFGLKLNTAFSSLPVFAFKIQYYFLYTLLDVVTYLLISLDANDADGDSIFVVFAIQNFP